MLENFFYPQLEQDNLLRTVYFQQDGATPHYAMITRDSLNATFGNRWIGRGGPTAWPPRSPELTVPDFFIWGYVKDRCYSPMPQNLEQLKENIRNVFNNITPEQLSRSYDNFVKRINKCIQVDGQHFEHLL